MKTDEVITGLVSNQILPELKFDSSKLIEKLQIDASKMQDMSQQSLTDKAKDDQTKTDQAKPAISAKKMQEFVDGLNKFMLTFDTSYKFQIFKDEGSDQVWVQILDAKTDKVLREVPSYDALVLAAKIKEFVGLFIDKWA